MSEVKNETLNSMLLDLCQRACQYFGTIPQDLYKDIDNVSKQIQRKYEPKPINEFKFQSGYNMNKEFKPKLDMPKSTNIDDFLDVLELDDKAKEFMIRTCKECKYRKASEPKPLSEEKVLQLIGRAYCIGKNTAYLLQCVAHLICENEKELRGER